MWPPPQYLSGFWSRRRTPLIFQVGVCSCVGVERRATTGKWKLPSHFFPPAAQRNSSCSMKVFRTDHLLKNADSYTPSPTLLFFLILKLSAGAQHDPLRYLTKLQSMKQEPHPPASHKSIKHWRHYKNTTLTMKMSTKGSIWLRKKHKTATTRWNNQPRDSKQAGKRHKHIIPVRKTCMKSMSNKTGAYNLEGGGG